jgi:MSHA biogenesis protein MshJ
MNRIHSLIAQINRATLRERALLLLAAAFIVGALWQKLLMAPIEARKTRIGTSLEMIRNRTASEAASGGMHAADEYVELKSREASLTQALATADLQLRDAQRGMIEPKQMVKVLTDVLERQKALKLVLLRNLPVQPLLAAAPPAADAAAPATTGAAVDTAPARNMGPYLHPVELVVHGDYLNVLAYLKTLESEHLGFQWRRFEFATTETGLEYRIQFMTLSMEPNWLGV